MKIMEGRERERKKDKMQGGNSELIVRCGKSNEDKQEMDGVYQTR